MQVPQCNVYSAADNSSFTSTKLFKGSEVRVYGKQGKRVFIRFLKNIDEQEGWVDEVCIFVGDIVRPGNTVGERKLFPGTVLKKVYARKSPDKDAPVASQLKKNERVNIISQSKEWYRIRLEFMDGSVGDGWVEKKMIQLDSKEKKTEADSSVDSALAQNAFRLFGSPVFSLYRFGTTQGRVGAAYDVRLSEQVWLGIPVSYSFSGGFWSVKGGLEGIYDFYADGPWSVFSKAGFFFERFSGNGRSFIAGTADVGAGLRYTLESYMSFELTPVSVQITPLTSEGVPWFVRAETVLGVRVEW